MSNTYNISDFIPENIQKSFTNGMIYDRNTNTFKDGKLEFSLDSAAVAKNNKLSNCSDNYIDFIVAVNKNLDPETKASFKSNYNKLMVGYSASGTDGIAKALSKIDPEAGKLKLSELKEEGLKVGDAILIHDNKGVKGLKKEYGHMFYVTEDAGKKYIVEMNPKGQFKHSLDDFQKKYGHLEGFKGNPFNNVELANKPSLTEPKVKEKEVSYANNNKIKEEHGGKLVDKPQEHGHKVVNKHDNVPNNTPVERKEPPASIVNGDVPLEGSSHEMREKLDRTCTSKVEGDKFFFDLLKFKDREELDLNKCTQDAWDKAQKQISKKYEEETKGFKIPHEGSDHDHDHSHGGGHSGNHDGGGNDNHESETPDHGGGGHGYGI